MAASMAFCMLPLGMFAAAEENQPVIIADFTNSEMPNQEIKDKPQNADLLVIDDAASPDGKALQLAFKDGSAAGFINIWNKTDDTNKDWSGAQYLQFRAVSPVNKTGLFALCLLPSSSDRTAPTDILKLDDGGAMVQLWNGTSWQTVTAQHNADFPALSVIDIPANFSGVVRVELTSANFPGLNTAQLANMYGVGYYAYKPGYNPAVNGQYFVIDDIAVGTAEQLDAYMPVNNGSGNGNSGNGSESGNGGNGSESGSGAGGTENNAASGAEENKMPADYKTGHQTISDKQGYYKLTGGEESDVNIQAFAIGVGNCQFGVEATAKAVEGSKAAKVKYTNGSEHGWVNLGFAPQKSDWSDATYLQFYIDNTEAKDNASDLGEPNPLELFYIKLNGSDTYRITYGADDISFLNLTSGKWETMKVEQSGSGINAAAIKIPAGYKGYLRIKLSEKNWGTLDAATLSNVTRFELYTLTPGADGDSSAYFDDFALIWGEGKAGGLSIPPTGDNLPVEAAGALAVLSAAAAVGFVFLKRRNSCAGK